MADFIPGTEEEARAFAAGVTSNLSAADLSNRRPAPDPDMLAHPDMTIMRLARRAPPEMPLTEVFGPAWANWLYGAASAAACPVDYSALPLLAAASTLIGHARWPAAGPWTEPPHMWTCCVGDSGSSKSPGADTLMRYVLPEIEQRMQGDFPDRHALWKAAAELDEAAEERWRGDVKQAMKSNVPPPLPPVAKAGSEPQPPRLRLSDVTIEKIGLILAGASPKGVMVTRDELCGWLLSMQSYNSGGRAFWIEAYGGRMFRVERVKHAHPIIVPRLAVAVLGTTQPDKLAELFKHADDGLLSRICWAWPDALPFKLGREVPNAQWAIESLDKLRLLELAPGHSPGAERPVLVPLTEDALHLMEQFGREMQARQEQAGGLMRSAYGKARGTALRLSLIIAMLRWCAEDGMTSPPMQITADIFIAACAMVDGYFMPSAERVFGDAAATLVERHAATLARWIMKERPAEVHVRHLQRKVRLPGLNTAEAIHAACGELIEAGWLIPPRPGRNVGRARAAYSVNSVLWEQRV